MRDERGDSDCLVFVIVGIVISIAQGLCVRRHQYSARCMGVDGKVCEVRLTLVRALSINQVDLSF